MDVNRLREGSFGSDRLDYLIGLEEDRHVTSQLISPLLLPHPEDFSDEDAPSPRLVGGRDYVRQNIYMLVWQFTLFIGYTMQRFACKFGLPKDCLADISYFEFFTDITCLALYGLALGWFVGINEQSRFRYIFSRSRYYAAIAFLATPIIYSAISNIDSLKHDLTDFSSWKPSFITIWALGMTLIAISIFWHIKQAWLRAGTATFAMYIFLRALMLGWFFISAYILAHTADVKVHLHHLYIGWGLALWADVNAPFSVYTLAIGCGIFVQGIGAYSFAPIFSENGCFETPAAAKVKCSFHGDSAFTLRICPSGGSIPLHECNSSL